MSMTDVNGTIDFSGRYGPWAVVAGASEGTGREFARAIAAEGVNLILIARRLEPLEALATELRAEADVEIDVASIDLASPDASAQISERVGDREVGLYVSNAGSDPNSSQFLDKPLEAWESLAARNVMTPMRCCYHFGSAMAERGRGGLLLVGSGACYGAGPHLAVYSGSKAFEQMFAEGLWSELAPRGVDVLYYAMSMTKTPELERLMASNGHNVPDSAADPAEVARTALAGLPNGPVQNWGQGDDDAGMAPHSPAQRRARIDMIAQASGAMFQKAD